MFMPGKVSISQSDGQKWGVVFKNHGARISCFQGDNLPMASCLKVILCPDEKLKGMKSFWPAEKRPQ